CHARIFRYRGTEIKMADVFQGKFCGECHGKVAFPPTTACERCHQDLPQPANRAQPILLGTLTMKRMLRPPEPVADSAARVAQLPADSNAVAGADPAAPAEREFVTTSLPPSVFPHWVHRIRFQCRVCHLELFEPRLGANEITMAAIDEGRFCGRCHNGNTAFDVSFDSCQRCHQPPEEDE
ncbi:MAG: c(7)-type cytochrome triheme domain-containing protein, partial [Gemmatimonadota bacterium]